jgi:oxysterol-binding protein-related protein 8
MFDVQKDGGKVAPIIVAPEDEQEPNESRRLWSALTRAIVSKDMDAAGQAKSTVEERERELRRKRDESGSVHRPRYFEERNGRIEAKIKCVLCQCPK